MFTSCLAGHLLSRGGVYSFVYEESACVVRSTVV